jgi:hypothetical protein
MVDGAIGGRGHPHVPGGRVAGPQFPTARSGAGTATVGPANSLVGDGSAAGGAGGVGGTFRTLADASDQRCVFGTPKWYVPILTAT